MKQFMTIFIFFIFITIAVAFAIKLKIKEYQQQPVTYKTECQFKNLWNQTPLGQCVCYQSGVCSWVWLSPSNSKRSK